MLRQQKIAQREALSDAEHATFSARVRRHLRDSFPQLARLRVGFCWPVRREADLRPLCEAWYCGADPGFSALLPVVHSKADPLAFRRWHPGGRMQIDAYGIPAPCDGAFVAPEALLLPVNAFDAQGYRLGYGAGFFDRTVASLSPRPLCIGIGFELARVASIWPQPHDAVLDAVVTEAGVFWPMPR